MTTKERDLALTHWRIKPREDDKGRHHYFTYPPGSDKSTGNFLNIADAVEHAGRPVIFESCS